MRKRSLMLALFLAFSFLLSASDFQRVKPVHLDHDGDKWAQKTLKKLSLEEKIGQLFMVRLVMPQFVNIKSAEYQGWRDQIARYHLGSLLLTVPAEGPSLSKSEPYEIAVLINELQHGNKVPLLMAADYERGQYRACLRPMTPAGPPILGLGRHRNLFLNCGHGHMGWTMACGSARIVADLMSGRMPEIDLDGLTLRR